MLARAVSHGGKEGEEDEGEDVPMEDLVKPDSDVYNEDMAERIPVDRDCANQTGKWHEVRRAWYITWPGYRMTSS